MSGQVESTPSTQPRVLGVDGGGTKTEWALLSSDGAEIANGVLPAANLRLTSDDALTRMFHALPDNATNVGVYLAGCANDADRSRLRGLVQTRWPDAAVTRRERSRVGIRNGTWRT